MSLSTHNTEASANSAVESTYLKNSHSKLATPRWIKYVILSTVIASFCAILLLFL